MTAAKDDHILPFTRLISASVIAVLVLAVAALYLEPDHTDWDFAWTILPRTSAILIGAGYTAGIYFFARLIMDNKWHRVQAGFLPITAFTICMFAATLLHWGRFHQGAIIFYLWTIIYALTPFLVPFVWWRNRATESRDLEENDLRFSSLASWALGIIGVIGMLTFLIVFIQPSILISLAPWKLTELTARIFAGWSILTSSALLSIAWDGRWSATRILMESAMVGITLTLLGLPRMWGDFDRTDPMTYFFVAGLALTLIVFIIIHLWLDRSSQQRNFVKRTTK
ncbi:MAG TPA: hypothetical protein VF896_10660 [Anaerolineales bacterium]